VRYQGTDAYDIRIATGGSASTFIDTNLLDKYGDDELLDGSLIVLRTSSGLSPQGEFARIMGYLETGTIATFDANLSFGISTGNTCMLISPEYPLRVLIEQANDALRDCGEVTSVDLSTVTVADVTEYALPAGFKNLLSVDFQTENTTTSINGWVPITDYYIVPSSANTNATLVFSAPFDAGYILRLTYNGFHPQLSVFNSPINEMIAPPLITLRLADKIMQWHGVTNENSNYANKILSELMTAQQIYPVRKLQHKTKFWNMPRNY
jgi:hypothetical protein